LEEAGSTMARCGYAVEPGSSIPDVGGGGTPTTSQRAVTG
jgi:hypothetical protein